MPLVPPVRRAVLPSRPKREVRYSEIGSEPFLKGIGGVWQGSALDGQ